jgi:hypothetical protein
LHEISLQNKTKSFISCKLLFSAAASGWAGLALAHPEFGSSVNPITTRGQIMPTTLLLAHPDLKTQRHLWSCKRATPHCTCVHTHIPNSTLGNNSNIVKSFFFEAFYYQNDQKSKNNLFLFFMNTLSNLLTVYPIKPITFNAEI